MVGEDVRKHTTMASRSMGRGRSLSQKKCAGDTRAMDILWMSFLASSVVVLLFVMVDGMIVGEVENGPCWLCP